jgi:predicted AlkP superfamily phosphohydrolase/phosphomutase
MGMNSKAKKNKKVMIIGLDGVPFSLLQDYMAKGYLPECQKILKGQFRFYKMQASIPDVSSTSWTSFMTGVNPGEHGIYGFMGLRPQTYKMFFPSFVDVQAPTVWDILGQNVDSKRSTLFEKYRSKLEGPLKSIVLNIPQTYPAPKLNGILTAGFVCPDLRKGTYPDSAYSYLQSMGYLSDINAHKAIDQRDEFFAEAFLALEKRAEAYEHFLTQESWDLFIGVITETDRIHHFFFDAVRDANHPYYNQVISFYKRLDETIGRLFDRFMEMTDGNGLFMTMSDHGFTVVEQEVNVNAWLKEIGFLKKNNEREYFDQIDFGTKAFAMDPARIYVNLENKYPRGTVKESDQESVVTELKNRLMELVDPGGRPVIKAVYENKELYAGPAASAGPEMVCLAHDGFDLKSSLQKEAVFGKGPFTGMHTQYDAHCILPEAVETNQQLHIEDLAGIILEHFTG